jgi:2-desacetyl-2-hydroxyethyl bacteriochlorophyllide A dehydrogenase
MQAAYLFGPRDLRFVEREPLPLVPDEVRIQVACSGICGTDIHVYTGMVFGARSTEAHFMGHEFSGRVVEIGSAVKTLAVGDRVTAIPNTPCGICSLCRSGRGPVCPQRRTLRSGSWAPTIVVPAQNTFRVPANVSDRYAALTEPLACAVRAVDRSKLRPGDHVAVIGGGPIGLFAAMVAKASGARTTIVSEPRPYRRAIAEQLGMDQVIDPTGIDLAARVRELTDGLGADVVFEAVGHPATMEQAIGLAAPGGTVVIIGVADASHRLAFAAQDLFFKELNILGTKGPTYGVERALGWLGKLDFDPVITHSFDVTQADSAIQLGMTGDAGKILLTP